MTIARCIGAVRGALAVAAALAALVLAATAARAQTTFEIKTPDINKGETELSFNYANQGRFPRNADPVRQGLEIGLTYSPTEWFLISAKVDPNQSVDADWVLTTAGVETQLRFGKAMPGFDFGWYTAVDVRVYRDATNTVTFGPILQFGTDKVSLTLNPFLAQSFGINRSDGIDFTYAVGGKAELQPGLALGFEAYGIIPDVGNSPGIAFQQHRIGPVLYLEGKIAEPRPGKSEAPKARLELGAFFGLTEATADLTGKAKLSLTW